MKRRTNSASEGGSSSSSTRRADGSKFWAQVVRHAMRKSDQRGLTLRVEPRGRTARLTADVFNLAGQSINQADAELTIVGPRQPSVKCPLVQSAPGRYQAEFATPLPGTSRLPESSTARDRMVAGPASPGVQA